MSTITDRKITDGQRDAVWVQHQQDRLTGTPQQNKAVFDEYAELIREHFNGAMDDIDDALGGVSTDFGQIEERVEALEEINVEDAAQSARASAESASASATQAQSALAEATSYATKHFKQRFVTTDSSFEEFDFNPQGYTYSTNDYYEVFVNGFKLNESEYDLDAYTIFLAEPIEEAGNVIEVCVTKYIDPATYVEQAMGYAEDAQGYASDAESHANTALSYAEQAEASVTSVSNAEERIRAVAVETEGYRNDAEGFKNDAETAASNASTSATQASGSATQAQTYAGNASTSSTQAQTYAGNASTSATQASGYANNASASATQASGYAQNSADSAEDSEAWAKGTKNGTPVSSTDAQYQNNAKYFAEESYKSAEAWAVGQRGGVDVPSTDPTYENNAKYWAEQSLANQYGAFIVKSASGEIASFSDGADDVPMKSLNVTITPKQSGSGDPSPSNVRPITGTSTANITVVDINLWDEEWRNGYYNEQTGEFIPNSAYVANKNPIPVPPNTSIYGVEGTNFVDTFFCYDANMNYIGKAEWGIDSGVRITRPNTAFIAFRTRQSYGNTYNHDISINYHSTDHEYHPYTGHTTPVPLGQIVYGGELDVTTGVLTITHGIVDLGSLIWQTGWYNEQQKWRIYHSLSNKAIGQNNILCECYPNAMTHDGLMANQTITGNAASKMIYIKDSSYSEQGVNALIASLSGKHLVYEIAPTQTVQLTPTQVASLLGENNVWADCGAVAVEYRADPTLAYNGISPSLASVIAPVEKTNIATRNYTTGSLLIMNNMLYKVAANIANGGAITPNTNVMATTLAEIISAL